MKKTQTYGAVLAEIQQLQQRAAELRKSELPGVIKRIREAIAAYELTAADLGLGTGTGGGAAAPAAPAAARRGRATATKAGLQTGVAKYRDPKTGKTWTGRGKPPLWIVGVKDRTPFLIDASQPPAESQRSSRPPKAGQRGARAATGRKRAGRKAAAAPADTRPEGGDTATA
jgi:DNA-binding protein H-NS